MPSWTMHTTMFTPTKITEDINFLSYLVLTHSGRVNLSINPIVDLKYIWTGQTNNDKSLHKIVHWRSQWMAKTYLDRAFLAMCFLWTMAFNIPQIEFVYIMHGFIRLMFISNHLIFSVVAQKQGYRKSRRAKQHNTVDVWSLPGSGHTYNASAEATAFSARKSWCTCCPCERSKFGHRRVSAPVP